MQKVYRVEYAGRRVRYSFLCPLTKHLFRDFIAEDGGGECDIRLTPELLEAARKLLPARMRDEYVEYRALIEPTARKLLEFGMCIFHSAAFVREGRAWLLTAPSGVGKTTQYLNWQRLFPNEIEMICGDMPVLERAEDGIIVHATSWCGKERIGKRGLSAPLAGVVLLEQANENRLEPLPPHDAIMPFFEQFIVRPETEKEIRELASVMDTLVGSVPLYRFANLGDDASTNLLRELTNEVKGAPNDKI